MYVPEKEIRGAGDCFAISALLHRFCKLRICRVSSANSLAVIMRLAAVDMAHPSIREEGWKRQKAAACSLNN